MEIGDRKLSYVQNTATQQAHAQKAVSSKTDQPVIEYANPPHLLHKYMYSCDSTIRLRSSGKFEYIACRQILLLKTHDIVFTYKFLATARHTMPFVDHGALPPQQLYKEGHNGMTATL
mgnify:CR=1 FL=1